MAEGLTHCLGQGNLTGVAEGSMSQIVSHSYGLCQVLVEFQRLGNRPGNAGYLQRVGHAGAVMVAFRLQKHLCFVHQTTERLAVDNLIRIPLECSTHILCPGCFRAETSLRFIGKGSAAIQLLMFQCFQFFPQGHFLHSCSTGNARYSRPVSIPSTVPEVISVILSKNF